MPRGRQMKLDKSRKPPNGERGIPDLTVPPALIDDIRHMIESAKVHVAVGIFALLLIVLIPLAGGDLQEMVGGLGFLLLLTLGILTLLVLVSAVLLHLMTGGGYDATFAVTGEGVGFFGGEKMKKVNEALVIGSLLTASPGPAGAALVNYGSDQNFIAWKDIRSMKVLEKDRYILIRPRWLVNPIPLYCTEQNYPQVLSLIRHYRPDLA